MRNRLVPNAAIAGLMLAAVLGGCAKSKPDDEPATANESAGDITPLAAEPRMDRPAPAPPPAPAVAIMKPAADVPPPAVTEPREPPAAPDAQMLDDADATGMTARVSRDAPAVNETAPE